ncbi:SAE2-domain-containing protein [Paraphaeosphaeria sporulosa]|uniref:SAE2-domain-containing protein n=1 Tax=Paraphaeosphaeria sporulosa TaxID=1460663 RepID=A0A177C4T2_9PLEO|nr:SAE2-domain-containing protein [Paraphaeosphaeria sporulosa]OAG01680.1 SAE2-domain-containing protein [Paraphaeosphaeria sporulosa]
MDFSAWAENNKALWARVYDEVIAPDLEKEWKKRTRPWFTSNNRDLISAGIEIHDAESKKKDDRLRYLDNHISNGVVEKAQLVEENARLKTLLRKTRGNTLSAEELATSTEDTTIPVGEYRQVTEKLDELNKRYHDAVQRIKYLERKNVSVMQKNKEMKDSVKAWQEYCDRHIEKKKAKSEPKAPKVQPKSNLAIETPAPLPHIPSSPGAAVMSTPQSLMPQDRSSPAPMIDPSDATVPPPPLTIPGGRSSPLPPVATGHADAISGPKNNRATFLGQLNSEKITSSQTTVPEVSEPEDGMTPRANAPMDDDEPEIVSERSLKRKRKPSTGANEATPDKRVRREEARKEAEFNILAELGEEPPPSNERKKRLPPNLARAHFNERIRAAKSGPFPMKTTLTTPKTAPAKTPAAHVPTPPSTSNHPAHTPSARPARRGALEAAPRPELVPDGRPVWRMSALEARKTPNASISKPSTPRTRLRDKALSELRLQDFKPNPAYNGGYTHAFTDTVRRREDRLCLPGCTKPSCCGSTFRALALALPPLSSSQEEALLQDYLGDAYSSFGLTQMDAAEREEIVTQARTRQMAKEHGKHRRTYEGRKTPPGFWRVDFPSTQEEREDREKAVQMGLVEVRERYLEAMRRGGRFVFADE